MSITKSKLESIDANASISFFAYRDYIDSLKNLKAQRRKEVEDKYAELFSKGKFKKLEEEVLHEFYEREKGMYGELFDHSFNTVFLVTLYSFFENTVKRIAEILYEDGKILKSQVGDSKKLSIAELYINGIRTLPHINFKDLDKLYPKLDEFRQIRNYVVHQDCRLSGRNPKRKNEIDLLEKYKNYIKVDTVKSNFTIYNKDFLVIYQERLLNYLSLLLAKVSKLI